MPVFQVHFVRKTTCRAGISDGLRHVLTDHNSQKPKPPPLFKSSYIDVPNDNGRGYYLIVAEIYSMIKGVEISIGHNRGPREWKWAGLKIFKSPFLR